MLGILADIVGVDDSIQVFMNPHMSEKHRQGVAFFETPNGLAQMGFKVNRARLLNNPKPEVVNELFEQLLRMGLFPDHLEIHTQELRRVYHYGKDEPSLVQRLI